MHAIVPDSIAYRQSILLGNSHEIALAAHEYSVNLQAIFKKRNERLKKEGWIDAVKI